MHACQQILEVYTQVLILLFRVGFGAGAYPHSYAYEGPCTCVFACALQGTARPAPPRHGAAGATLHAPRCYVRARAAGRRLRTRLRAHARTHARFMVRRGTARHGTAQQGLFMSLDLQSSSMVLPDLRR